MKYKCLYSASSKTYIKPQIDENITILFIGGGNFGDLWESHQIFRHCVMKDFPMNPIVQLPQSVFFQSQEKLKEDIEIFDGHKGNVTICLRDQQSYDIIQKYYKNVTAMLLPDMVLGLDISVYLKKFNINVNSTKGDLYVRRTDLEVYNQHETDRLIPLNAITADWPSLCNRCHALKVYYIFCHFFNILRINHRGIDDFIFMHYLKNIIIKSGIKFLSSYKRVYTTRLHCGIIAFLMGKEVIMFDNFYKKISGVYNLWLNDQPNIKML
ncbi:MAG: polysaccharide pyruvyl transferase family protein [Prevotella sp.]|nr:polysaccharide pyruvyl transferase family protein [Prevotella sp.]